MSSGTPKERKMTAAQAQLFRRIQRQHGNAGLDFYLKLSERDRLAWEQVYLPDTVDTTASAYNLTRREVEICHLSAQGLESRMIAESLAVSPRTVEFHKANIRAKSGTKSMLEALAKIGTWEFSTGEMNG